MNKTWNRKSKFNKLTSLVLALLLAMSPLATYIGDNNGTVKAEETTGTTIEYYTDSLSEATKDAGSAIALKSVTNDTTNTTTYYLQFLGENATTPATKEINYVAGTLKFAVNPTLSNYSHKYNDQYSNEDTPSVTFNDYDIKYIQGSSSMNDLYLKDLTGKTEVSATDSCISINSTTSYTDCIAVYIKPTISGGESTTITMGYTLVGVYTFTKVDMPTGITWTGTDKNNSNQTVVSGNKYSAATLGCTLPTTTGTLTGEWKYLSIKSNSEPTDSDIKSSTAWSTTTSEIKKSNSDIDGTYYGYVGYFSKGNSTDTDTSTLISYSATSTPVKIDAKAPTISDLSVQYKAASGDSYASIQSEDLSDGKFELGSGDSLQISFGVTDASISSASDITLDCKIGNIAIAADGTYDSAQNKITYTATVSASSIASAGNPLSITATDSAGNVSEATTYKIDGTEVKFSVAGSTFDVSASIIDSSGNATNTLSNGGSAITTKDSNSSVKITIKSDKTAAKADQPSQNYQYTITGFSIKDDGFSNNYSRPYYYTYITNALSEGKHSIGVTYYNNGSKQEIKYNDIICDYTAPTIKNIYLQTSSDNGNKWENVAVADTDNNIHYINFADTNQYRYYIEVEDTAGKGVAADCTSGLPEEITVQGGSLTYIFKKSAEASNGYAVYTADITLADLPNSDTAAAILSASVTDLAGNKSNESNLTRLVRRETETDINLSVIDSNGNKVDLSDIQESGSYITNSTLTVKAIVTSAAQISNVTLTGKLKDGDEQKDKTFEPTNKTELTNDKGIYSITYTFEVPEETNVNALISSGKLEVTTNVKELIAAGTLPNNTDSTEYDKTVSLTTILYDQSKPVFKAVIGGASVSFDTVSLGWQNSYTLNYKILSGEDSNVESDLASATYVISGSTDSSANNTYSVSGTGTEYNGSINVPESATTSGTRIAFAATDAAGNSSDVASLSTKEIYIKVDKTAPVISNISVTNFSSVSIPLTGAPNISTTISDNLTLSSAVMTVTYPDGTAKTATLGETEENNLTKSLSYQLESGAPDGEYNITVTATDKAGNKATVKSMTFKLDNTKPVVTAKISSGTVGGKSLREDGTDMYYSSDVGVTFTCEDSNIKNIVVTDNDSELSVTWNNNAGSISVSGEGRHVIKINAVDKSGNQAAEKQVEFIVDKTAPTISVALNGLAYTEDKGVIDCLGDSTVSVNVTDMTEDSSDFYCQIILTRPYEETQTPQYIQTDRRTFSFSEEGDYTINFYTMDMANNKSATRSVSFRIDKTAPEVSISGVSSGGTSSNAANVRFSLKEAFWKDADGTITIYRKADDASEEALYKTINVSPTAYETITTESLTETGVYRMEFTATDRMGHKSETSQTFTIDRDAPVVTLTGVSNYDITSDTVEFKAEITDDFYSSKTVSIEGTRTDINGKKTSLSFASFNQHGNPTTINESFVEDGIYDIIVTATDIAGSSHTSAVHFTVDKTAPVISGIDDLDDKILKEVDLDFDLDEIVTDLTVCDVHMYLNGSEYDGVSDIEDGSYTLLITAEDELGQTSEKSVSFVLDTRAPVFIVTGVEDGEAKLEDYSIDVSLQLDEDSLKEVTLNGEIVTVTDNTAHIDVTAEGDYTLYMKAIDEAGNEAEQTIEFRYGKEVNAGMIILIIIIILLILAAITFFIILAKRRKKDE